MFHFDFFLVNTGILCFTTRRIQLIHDDNLECQERCNLIRSKSHSIVNFIAH